MARFPNTRLALLDAAAREFAARGYHGAGVDRISRAAGVNKRMIYHHFGGKSELLRAVLEDRLGTWAGGSLAADDAALLLAEAEWVKDGGAAVLAAERGALLQAALAEHHPAAVLAALGVRLLPSLLPQLRVLLALPELPDEQPELVLEALARAGRKARITLRPDTAQAASERKTSK